MRIQYINFPGRDPYADCYIEDYASGITGYSLITGTTNCFSGGTNYALISSGASGDNASTIAKSITSRTVSSLSIKFNIEANAIDDAGIVGARDFSGAFAFSFIPSREKAIDASERAFINIGGSHAVSTSKLTIGANYQLDLTINVGSAASAVITNLDTPAVEYTTTLPILTRPTVYSIALNIDNAPNVKRTRYTYFRLC